MADTGPITRTYILHYADERSVELCSVQITAATMAEALSRIQRLALPAREATLTVDGEPIVHLTYSPEGFWIVSGDE